METEKLLLENKNTGSETGCNFSFPNQVISETTGTGLCICQCDRNVQTKKKKKGLIFVNIAIFS